MKRLSPKRNGTMSALALSCFLLATAHGAISYNFDDGTLQGWTNTMVGSTVSNPAFFSARENQGKGGGQSPEFSLMHDGDGPWVDGRDNAHDTLVCSSPAFALAGTEAISFYLLGGTGDGSTPSDRSDLSAETSSPGFMGVALRRVSDGEYILHDQRNTSNQNSAWERQGWDVATIAAAITGDVPGETYQLDFIDQNHGGWGWIILDTVNIATPILSYTWVGGDDSWFNGPSWDGGIAPTLDPIEVPVLIGTGIADIGAGLINLDSSLTITGVGGVSKSDGSVDSIRAGGLLDLQGGTTTWDNARFYIKGTSTEGGEGDAEVRISGGTHSFKSSEFWMVGRDSSGHSQLTISGGDTTIESGTATCFGGFKGTDCQVDMTEGALTIVGALWMADQGNIVVNHSGGNMVIDSILMGRSNGNDTTDSYYTLSGDGDLYVNEGLVFGNGTITPDNNIFTMDGGTMSVAGITHIAGEFVFNEGELTVRGTNVADTILGEAWFIEATGTTAFFNGTDTIIASDSVIKPATIVGWSYVPGENTMRMVILAPSAPVNYQPQATVNLVGAEWVNVPHSDNGTNPFIISDLSYSTTEGNNLVIYVQTTDAVKFFKITP